MAAAFLPHEIANQICTYFALAPPKGERDPQRHYDSCTSHQHTLHQLCLTCTWFYHAAYPHLYHVVFLPDADGAGHAAAQAAAPDGLRLLRLVRTMLERPPLRRLVKHIICAQDLHSAAQAVKRPMGVYPTWPPHIPSISFRLPTQDGQDPCQDLTNDQVRRLLQLTGHEVFNIHVVPGQHVRLEARGIGNLRLFSQHLFALALCLSPNLESLCFRERTQQPYRYVDLDKIIDHVFNDAMSSAKPDLRVLQSLHSVVVQDDWRRSHHGPHVRREIPVQIAPPDWCPGPSVAFEADYVVALAGCSSLLRCPSLQKVDYARTVTDLAPKPAVTQVMVRTPLYTDANILRSIFSLPRLETLSLGTPFQDPNYTIDCRALNELLLRQASTLRSLTIYTKLHLHQPIRGRLESLRNMAALEHLSTDTVFLFGKPANNDQATDTPLKIEELLPTSLRHLELEELRQWKSEDTDVAKQVLRLAQDCCAQGRLRSLVNVQYFIFREIDTSRLWCGNDPKPNLELLIDILEHVEDAFAGTAVRYVGEVVIIPGQALSETL